MTVYIQRVEMKYNCIHDINTATAKQAVLVVLLPLTLSVSMSLLSKMLAQFLCSGNSPSVYVTSGFCSQMWLWIRVSFSLATSPSSFSSLSEHVGAKRGVMMGWTKGFWIYKWRRHSDQNNYTVYTLAQIYSLLNWTELLFDFTPEYIVYWARPCSSAKHK